jgi:hypothetical protein
MTLENLKQFLSDCIKAEIPFPRETMKVVISDFENVVPEQHRNTRNLEFTHREGNEFAKVIILPEPKN